jgi:FkbM family methyltransferase
VILSGVRLASEAYKDNGFRGLLLDVNLYIRGVWHTLRNTPVASQGVTVPSPRELGVFRTAEILAGRYEQEEAELVKAYVPDASDVVELGGGIGFITAMTEHTTDNIGRHLVLEMNPQLHPILRKIKEANQLEVHIDKAAYAAQSESVRLEPGDTYTQTSVSETSTKGEPIPAKSLSALVDEYDLNQFALIVDIEGAERGLLEDEFDTMVEHCPVVIMELHRSSLGGDLTPHLEKLRSEYTLKADKDPVFAFRWTN